MMPLTYCDHQKPGLFYFEPQHDDELRRLHTQGLTDAEITAALNARFGLNLRKQQVAMRRSRMYLLANKKTKKGVII